MSEKSSIPNAFPYSAMTPDPRYGGQMVPTMYADCEGMSLRDYFAAAALQILPTLGYKAHLTPEQAAYAAYEMANLMLKAREVEA